MGNYIDIDFENDIQKGIIYIINAQNDNEFKNQFKFDIFIDQENEPPLPDELAKDDTEVKGEELKEDEAKEEPKEEEKKENGEEPKEEDKKEEHGELKEKIEEKKKGKDKYKVGNFIDFKKAKKYVFSKLEIELKNSIKSS